MKLKFLPIHLILSNSRKKSRKKSPYIGEEFLVPRDTLKPVKVYLYKPDNDVEDKLPVMINVHGGAWVAGDGVSLDMQSKAMANRLSAFVVSVEYKLADEKAFPYPQQEIVDTVLFFAENSERYNIDPKRISLIGYSAGGHLCAGAAIMLKNIGFELNSQILCYPFLDFVNFRLSDYANGDRRAPILQKLIDSLFFTDSKKEDAVNSPAVASDEELKGVAPCEIIACATDVLLSHAQAYYKRLVENGISVNLKIYEEAQHGFLEVNYPDTAPSDIKTPEQERIMKECEEYIADRVRKHWGNMS